jgi:hypothetical protein
VPRTSAASEDPSSCYSPIEASKPVFPSYILSPCYFNDVLIYETKFF